MKKFSSIKNRIRQYAKKQGISISEIYEKTQIANGTLSNSSGMSEDSLLKFFSKYQDVSLEWLLTGSGPMLRSAGPEGAKQPLIGPVESRLLELLDQKDGRITDLEEQVKRLKKEEEPGLDYYHVAEPEIKLKAPKGKKKD